MDSFGSDLKREKIERWAAVGAGRRAHVARSGASAVVSSASLHHVNEPLDHARVSTTDTYLGARRTHRRELTIQFDERRPTPMIVPRIVAAMMPEKVIRSMLTIPTASASNPVAGSVLKPSRSFTPNG